MRLLYSVSSFLTTALGCSHCRGDGGLEWCAFPRLAVFTAPTAALLLSTGCYRCRGEGELYLKDVEFAAGGFVAVGGWRVCDGSSYSLGPDRMAILVSDDGGAWDDVSPDIDVPLAEVVWDGTRWLAVGGGIHSEEGSGNCCVHTAIAMTSLDGRTWQATWQPTEEPIHRLEHVAYGWGRYVALAHSTGGEVLYVSVDGELWERRGVELAVYGSDGDEEPEDELVPSSVAFGAGVFVLGGSGNGESLVAVSKDGDDWVMVRGASYGNAMGALSWVDGRFVAAAYRSSFCEGNCGDVGENNRITWSPDGREWGWTEAPYFYAQSITHHDSIFVAANRDGILRSTDGSTWEQVRGVDHREGYFGAAHGEGLFVVVGEGNDEIVMSQDGRTWDVAFSAH